MKKYLIAFALLFATVAWAQDGVVTVGSESSFYAGASLGLEFLLPDEEFAFDGYFGFRDLLGEDLDLRANLGVVFGGVDLTTFGASVIYNADDVGSLTPYLGGGLRLFFNGDTELGLGFVGGADIDLSGNFDLFTEFKSDINLDGGSYGGVAFGGKFNF